MNRDPRQQAYLKAMGIDVWVQRNAISTVAAPVVEETASPISRVVTEEVEDFSLSLNDVSVVKSLDWSDLKQQVESCQLCELHATRTQAVFGVGNQQADWLIVGEAPGADEDRQGEPFVGRAGQLLNEMLKAIGLKREQVYIANILKCRPPNNRDPKPEEAASCSPYLQRQIELIQPKVILALGRIAAQRLLQCNTSLARLRGQAHQLETTQSPVIVTYHPAYLLRSPAEKRKAWQDLQFARKHVAQAIAAESGL
ncbi:MAG: uracil-DNA glycosylase [Gammaproteobacteria bacterium]|nr:uracil-DNA glycosylase [Gammaproteobacteria bacterium]